MVSPSSPGGSSDYLEGLLQAGQRAPLQKILAATLPELDGLKQARKVRWSIDVDPVSLD